MGQSFVAYGASMDNPMMAPLNSTPYFEEEGTNGQTIDLLIREKTAIVPLNEETGAIFDLLKNPLVHAIMDVGADFRGMNNEAVAKRICQELVKNGSPIKGVLFFGTKKGNFSFMSTEPPHNIQPLPRHRRKDNQNGNRF